MIGSLSDDKQPTVGSLTDPLNATFVDEHGLTQELYRKNVELAHTNHTLSLLRTIDNLVIEPANSLRDLTQGITDALIKDSSYIFGVLFIKQSRNDELPMSVGGFSMQPQQNNLEADSASMKRLLLNVTDPWFASPEFSKSINIGAERDSFLDQIFGSQAEVANSFALKCQCPTIYFVKLLARHKLVGIMLVGLPGKTTNLNLDELEYLGRIGEAAGLAIDNKLLFQENQEVLRQLKESNEKLKELDEAKDEFISMASHQLRTPLTSVKGYVSMVIEGDAGSITKQQKELLTQAFASAQRMVYLIADLLNVSRLKTGKFIIEPVKTQLADVVEGEVAQLRQSASAHNLTLTYNKPSDFPILNIDETKTRQVIMNFIDNAIYYTPYGGHINVSLTVNDATIDFKVTDDGLGVPKEEQPKLFTKFYRAENAKKARPDGTGLGLFMAKKVILAQGGTLIFQSEEGKGSIFGFSFPKTGLEVNSTAVVESSTDIAKAQA